jgi:hypothetical protein
MATATYLLSFSFAIGSVMVIAGVPVVDYVLRQKIRAARFVDDFFANAQSLIEDEDVSEDIVELVLFMGRNIRKAWTVRSFVLFLLTNGPARKNSAVAEHLFGEIKRLTPQQRDRLGSVIVSFALAITFTSLIVGPAMRRLMWAMTKNAPRPHPSIDDNRVHAIVEVTSMQVKAA